MGGSSAGCGQVVDCCERGDENLKVHKNELNFLTSWERLAFQEGLCFAS